MDGGEDPDSNLYRVLLDRCQRLEASHQKLKEQVSYLLEENPVSGKDSFSQEKEMTSDSGDGMPFPGWSRVPGAFLLSSPYRSVLEYMGHAVHVSRAGSGEIIYWNCAAEKLFGYKDHEVVGQRVVELLFHEEHYRSASEIMERLSTGESWSGQLPLKKRSGHIFIAMVTKNPLYEDGELTGVVTVSSDAAVFNSTENSRTDQDHGDEQSNGRRVNLRKIQWYPQPQIPSSVSNLVSKVLLRKRGDFSNETTSECVQVEGESQDPRADRPPRVPTGKPALGLFNGIGRSRNEATSCQKAESTPELAQPSNIAAKIFSKFQRGDIQQNGSPDTSTSKEETHDASQERETTSRFRDVDANNHSEDSSTRTAPAVNLSPVNESSFTGAFSGCFESAERSSPPSCEKYTVANGKAVEAEDASPRQSDSRSIPSSGESCGSGPGSSSSRGGSDSHKVRDCPIRWEDLKLLEEVGHGSFAVVYRGVWNESDVAVKVYYGNQYNEQTLLDYKKEIDIMKRLRHPNVLLFMGAVSSEEKLAMVTEYLTRGSLFKTLHKNNQSMDIRRRLRMATDVARGMNYLHHRNPPIVHRDLKSSNLLVDKSWTVKVGDFGLSKLKDATFLTAKSGRGTPQWMAPEVLRNDPSTEKSDVFSFGVILWELMTESIPWGNLNALQVVGVVGFMDRRLDLPQNMDPRVSSIITDCWRSKPDDRPSFEDIISRMANLVQTANGPTTRRPSTP